jgi:hypothetical protein
VAVTDPSTAIQPATIDWGLVTRTGLALVGVVGLFWLGMHFLPVASSRRKRNPISTRVQSLLFSRDAGWTVSSANRWARAHGYRAKDADVTANNVRLRQVDPKKFSRLRTVTFSQREGIKAIVGR